MKRITIRKLHKWIAWILSIQVALWGISGAYMVWMKLSYIHGGHLAENAEITTGTINQQAFRTITERYPNAEYIKWVNRGLVDAPEGAIEVKTRDELILFSSESLFPIQPSREDIERIASRVYTASSEASIRSITFLHQSGPGELSSSHLPVWQVEFDDWVNTTLYFKAETAELVTRRFSFWRAFDFFWMLHIMDYKTRANIQTPWLVFLTLLSIGFIGTGTVLTVRRLKPRKRRVVGAR
ncbi:MULTISPECIES: hypothetical protein [Gammaproteobacteria]|uniref:hypothetical protein n=1 Tax=Gammaproteobacteria TaxID=1236 RepID=UPI000DD0DA06|nr:MULTISPECIES: hypothetical protein [Gammaproteobacteria]RTE86408.1 hypothetical protein DQX04_07555 [Aliidiomarina sp. B3213]TCZ91756.1 hypothetical protein EYQ95_07560 [Lysobacter sp. N42]